MDRITQEELERTQDIDIYYSDLEKQLKEDLELLKVEAENEQKKMLKDRQTQEKMAMFQSLMGNMAQND